jgi:general secretion pathway protein C
MRSRSRRRPVAKLAMMSLELGEIARVSTRHEVRVKASMQTSRGIVTGVIVGAIGAIAFLDARGVTSLVDAAIGGAPMLGTSTSASARAHVSAGAKSADPVLDRNPFDHATGPLRPARAAAGDAALAIDDDPRTAPICEGVRPLVLVGQEDQSVAFAALDVGGKRLLRKRGGDVGDKQVAYVGRDRVWLSGEKGLCQALLFAPTEAPKTAATSENAPPRSALEAEIGKQIVKTGPNEYAIDRSAVDRIIEAQAELMKQRIVQDKEADRVVGVKIFNVKPGSVVSMLGIENGDRLETINGFELSSPERMLEAFARLRAGADKLQVHLTRAGQPVNLDYAIR